MHYSFHACIQQFLVMWKVPEEVYMCTQQKPLSLIGVHWSDSLSVSSLTACWIRKNSASSSLILQKYNVQYRVMTDAQHCLTEMAKNNWQALFRAIHTCTNQSQCTRLELLCNAKSHLMLHRHCEAWSVHRYHGNNLWWAWLVFSAAAHMYINIHCSTALKKSTLINAEVD